MVKYVNYKIVISIINSLSMKIIEVRENLPKRKTRTKRGYTNISEFFYTVVKHSNDF